MRILISGASIAGPVLAYWLARGGFDVTVVERAPALRKTGGHAVDLFRPSMEISAKMGVLPRIESLATGTDRLTLYREGRSRPARVDLTKIVGAASDRHVEIMRDDLSEVYYDAGREHIEYVFGDSITAISPDGEVTFEHAAARRFDVIVGADGLHSNVRRLVFGDEAGLTRFIGGYLAVVSVPKSLAPEGEMIVHAGVGRIAGIYTAQHLDDARALFMFRQQDRAGLSLPRHSAAEGITARRARRVGCAGRQLAGRSRPHAHLLFRLDQPTRTGYLVTGASYPRRRCRILPRARGGWQHQPGGHRGVRAGRRTHRGSAEIICAHSRPTSTRWPRRSVVAGSSRAAPPRPSFPAPPRGCGPSPVVHSWSRRCPRHSPGPSRS